MAKKDGRKNFNADEIAEEVNKILAEIRPRLLSHGGDARLVRTAKTEVEIKVLGACDGCALASLTFGAIVEGLIKERLPQIKEVVYN